MRVLIAVILCSAAGVAQAFNVNVGFTERQVDAGLLAYPAVNSVYAPADSTGSWTGDVVYFDNVYGDYASASLDLSIDPSGSYDTYSLSIAGDYDLFSADLAYETGNNAGVSAWLYTAITIDQDVIWEFDCGGELVIATATGSMTVNQCFDGMGTGTLTAGTYSFYIENNAYTDDYYALTYGSFNANLVLTAVPVPGAVWLFGSGLGLLGWIRGRRTTSRLA